MINACLENAFTLLVSPFFLLFKSLTLFPSLKLFQPLFYCSSCGKKDKLMERKMKDHQGLLHTNHLDGLNFISFRMRPYVLQLLYWEFCPECTTCWPSQWRHPGKRPPARGAFLAACEYSQPVLGSPSGTGISYGTFLPSAWTRWCPAGAGDQIETPCLFICKKKSKRNRIWCPIGGT